ncbi:MAG: response regulator, partial [Candidatus Binatia bacterium]
MNPNSDIGNSKPETRNPRVRVLVVEDDPGYADLLREILVRENDPLFALEWVDQLQAGLARLVQGGVDVILLDLSLPDSQGIDTFKGVHAQAPHVPVVVLTGLDDETVAIKAVQEGAQDYLVKGQVSNRMLLRAIRYAIERQRTEEQLRRQMQRLAVLREINQAITSSLDLHAVLDILLEKIDLLLPYSALMVWLLESESGALDLIACRNLNEEEAKGWKKVMEYKAPVVVSNLQTDPR